MTDNPRDTWERLADVRLGGWRLGSVAVRSSGVGKADGQATRPRQGSTADGAPRLPVHALQSCYCTSAPGRSRAFCPRPGREPPFCVHLPKRHREHRAGLGDLSALQVE